MPPPSLDDLALETSEHGRRLRASAGPSGGGVVSYRGTVRGQDGTLRATALTQGRMVGR
jgi:hypothetical protein